jgi:hypothetical protein
VSRSIGLPELGRFGLGLVFLVAVTIKNEELNVGLMDAYLYI